MPRFYLTVYLAFVGILLIFGLLVAGAWFLSGGNEERGGHWRQRVLGASQFIGESVPPTEAPPAQLERWLARAAVRLEAEVAVFGPDGALVAASGTGMRPPEVGSESGGQSRIYKRQGRFRADVRLADGRWLSLVHRRSRRHGPPWLLALALLAVAVGIGAYPVARRITGRVERLQSRVDALGGGDLGARIAVEGRDEVADLARSFNRAAERVQSLVDNQRMMLASASHELRSPLTRIRMGLELLAGGEREALATRLRRDVDDLDELIEELLFASRLETLESELERSPVDLLALLAEEGARADIPVSGQALNVRGEARLLRRLIRNLIENGIRHGGGAPVSARTELAEGLARLVVEDEGPGVPESERERIFEPFYRPAGMREGRDRGVGLGLALVRRIAERHGGTAYCEGRAGGGTRVVVDFPIL